MPITTPPQKIKQVKLFGKDKVEVVLQGDTFDEASDKAHEICKEDGAVFIHPFDDEKVIAGQGTIALEILEDAKSPRSEARRVGKGRSYRHGMSQKFCRIKEMAA